MMVKINNYYDLDRTRKFVEDGRHRECVGGFWEELGVLPFDFLLKQGMKTGDNFLDIGCGCLRVGVFLVDYLESGNYFGTDLSQELLDAGYDIELKNRGLQEKLPRKNLICDEGFCFDVLPVKFDLMLAQSVFTHLPSNHIQLCLHNLRSHVNNEGVFYATFFIVSNIDQWSKPVVHKNGGVKTHPCNDPYHYLFADIKKMAESTGWSAEYLGDWGHPRDQKMVAFRLA
jgi:cyclopropane fatty-acyl-phospholipid synthase-like methyltransferase